MKEADKPIVLTRHAGERMRLRGATEGEVTMVVREGSWASTQRGRFHSTRRFEFGQASPVNGIQYAYKTLDVVFSDESEQIVVLTVKVYYHD